MWSTRSMVLYGVHQVLMGRKSLLALPLRTRTVDNDLADNNMTRKDIASGEYAFKRVWARLRSQGWYSKPGPALSYDHFYIKPGKDLKTGVEDVDYFYGEANLSAYGQRIKLFEDENAVQGTSANGRPAATSPSTSNGRPKPVPTIKTEEPPAAVHVLKGRHAEDAIEIDLEDSDVEEKPPAYPRRKDAACGKRKIVSSSIQDEEDAESEDFGDGRSVESDATGYSEASTETSVSKRPLLRTKVTKKQKLERDRKEGKTRYKRTIKPKQKVKNSPRGMLFEKEFTDYIQQETTPPSAKIPRKTPPPSPHRTTEHNARHVPVHNPAETKPHVAHGLESEFNATVKEELTAKEEPTAFAPPTPPPRPPSRASSVASSHRSSSVPRSAATTTLLDAEGVMFPACPMERYRVLITQSSDGKETTILIEENSTYTQRHFTFDDITLLSAQPNNLIPHRALYQALYNSIVTLSENVVVHPPGPPESKSSASGNDASSINFCRNESSEWIELRYPDTSFWSLPHRFPMTLVPESRQVLALREELGRTKRALRTTQRKLETTQGKLETALRDLEAFRKQHEQLEGEYQKVRKALEQSKQQQQQATVQPHPPPRARSQSPAQVPTQAQSTPPRAHVKAQAKVSTTAATQPSPQAKSQQAPKPPPMSQETAQPQAKSKPQPAPASEAKSLPPSHAKAQRQSQAKAQSQAKPVAPSPARSRKQSQLPRQEEEKQQHTNQVRVSTVPPKTQVTTSGPATTTSIPVDSDEPPVFQAKSNWLDTKFLKCPPGSPWIVRWSKKLITVNPAYYTVISDNGVPRDVKINVTGSYKFTMNIHHASSMRLHIVVIAAGSRARPISYHPQRIEASSTANGEHHQSFFNQVVQCSANDIVYAELRPRDDSDLLPCEVEKLEKFSASMNVWHIEWIKSGIVMNGTTNGKKTH